MAYACGDGHAGRVGGGDEPSCATSASPSRGGVGRVAADAATASCGWAWGGIGLAGRVGCGDEA